MRTFVSNTVTTTNHHNNHQPKTCWGRCRQQWKFHIKIVSEKLPRNYLRNYTKINIYWSLRSCWLIFINFNFVDRNSKSIPKIEKSAPQNLKFDFDFEFWGLKFDFEILKIAFFNSSRISFRDHQIRNQRCRKPPNLHFRFKIHIFASNFSSTKILILY